MSSKNAKNKQKKSQQQNVKNNHENRIAIVPKKPILTLNKRNELTTLVKQLLTASFAQPHTPKEEWDQFVCLNELLQKIIGMESVLQRPIISATTTERLKCIEHFHKWAVDNGCKCEGVSISEFDGYDLGLKAERNFVKGEQIIAVPVNLMLSEEILGNDYLPPKLGVMSNIKLTYTLMLETLKQESFFSPYLKILPSQFTSVGYFTKSHMEQLRGSNVLPKALNLYRSIARQYAFIYDMLQNQPRSKTNDLNNAIKDYFSYELYRWSVSCVMTRENLIPRSKPVKSADGNSETMVALVPFWDLINHKTGTVSTVYHMEKCQVELAAPENFAAGEQLFMHYGNRSNGEMLLHNGFVDVDNPSDFMCIKLGLSSTDKLREKRALLLQLVSPDLMPNDEHHWKILPAPQYFSPEILAFVRVFNMNEAQLDHWLETDRAQDLKHIDCALETQLEQKTWQYLQTRMMLQLRAFPTTLEQDLQRLTAVQMGELKLDVIDKNILQYLILEKHMLQGALEYARQRIKA